MAGLVQSARRPPGWVAPGPAPTGGVSPGDDEDLCYLSGDWRLFQKQQGHRWSLDDLLTAHFAAAEAPAPARCLDLGCGVGSVLLMVAWRFPGADCVGVEAQAPSAALARKSIAFNGVGHRVRLIEGDFREAALPGRFDLVTGTPPYFPLGSGTLSRKIQAGPCRFEHRGGVEAYCEAAARLLSEQGRFVFCASALERDRAHAAVAAAGLHLRRWRAVVPREGKAPLIDVFVAQREPTGLDQPVPLVVRDRAGQWTQEFLSIRAAMGLPPRPAEVT